MKRPAHNTRTQKRRKVLALFAAVGTLAAVVVGGFLLIQEDTPPDATPTVKSASQPAPQVTALRQVSAALEASKDSHGIYDMTVIYLPQFATDHHYRFGINTVDTKPGSEVTGYCLWVTDPTTSTSSVYQSDTGRVTRSDGPATDCTPNPPAKTA